MKSSQNTSPHVLSPKELLISDAQNCSLCPRMQASRRVLTDRNGAWNAQVLFIAEAPGRLGAEVTGIPLFGDRTGDRFDAMLEAMHWRRSSVFLTNAVLCNPRDEKGNNDKPTVAEINHCSAFLRRTIEVLDPILVIALGRVALDVLRSIHTHDCQVRTSCGKVVRWGDRHLGVLYHPSPRTQTQRAWELQLGDAKSISLYARKQLGVEPVME
jgi:uracil-DNA glycosylase family 4